MVYENFIKALSTRAQQNAKGETEAYYSYMAGYMDSVLLGLIERNPEVSKEIEKVTAHLINLVEEEARLTQFRKVL
jgi:hypothetical protein